MVSQHSPPAEQEEAQGESATGNEGLTNKIIKVLCLNGDMYKTFGENIILLLNRESRYNPFKVANTSTNKSASRDKCPTAHPQASISTVHHNGYL